MKLLSFRPLMVIGLAATLSACASQAPAAKAPAASPGVKTALWVGNSFFYYNNSMHSHVAQLISNANPGVGGYRAVSATTSGSGIVDMVRVVNNKTDWDLPKRAGRFVVLDIKDFTFGQWTLLIRRHFVDYRAPLVLHPVLLKK